MKKSGLSVSQLSFKPSTFQTQEEVLLPNPCYLRFPSWEELCSMWLGI